MSRHILPRLVTTTLCLLATLGNVQNTTPTRKSHQELWVAWWEIPPFAFKEVYFEHERYHELHNHSRHVNGALSNVLHDMVDTCYPGTRLRFVEYQNEKQLFENIGPASNITFAFPVVRSLMLKDMDRLLTNISFIPIVETPGPLILAEQGNHGGAALASLLGTWPLLLVVFSTASIAGIIVWALDHYWNPDDFPVNFLVGFWEGMWWAFVSMTTVGYGDKTVRSVPARLFGFLWIIVGVVIMSIFTATLTTAFSSEHLDPSDIIGLTVGVMTGTQDSLVGFMYGAQTKGFPSIHALLDALINDESIHYVLVDTFNGFHSSVAFDKKGVAVKGIVRRPSVHGMLVYGQPPEKLACLAEVISHTSYQIYEDVEGLLHVMQSEVGQKSFKTSTNILGSMLKVTYASLGVWATMFTIAVLYDLIYLRPRRKRHQANAAGKETNSESAETAAAAVQKQPHHRDNDDHSNDLDLQERSNGTVVAVATEKCKSGVIPGEPV